MSLLDPNVLLADIEISKQSSVKADTLETCATCRYWKPIYEDFGSCRRYAPKPDASIVRSIASSLSHLVWIGYEVVKIDHDSLTSPPDWGPESNPNTPEWPRTQDVDWCGEFKALTHYGSAGKTAST